MTITVTFDPPLSTDSPSVFAAKAHAMMLQLNTFATQLNDLKVDVNGELLTLDEAVQQAVDVDIPAAVALVDEAVALTAAGAATAAKVAAEDARDTCFVNAKGADTIEVARALVGDDDTFIVYDSNAMNFEAYRRTSSTTQVFLGSHLKSNFVLGQLALTDSRGASSLGAGEAAVTSTSAIADSRPAALDGRITALSASAAIDGNLTIEIYRPESAAAPGVNVTRISVRTVPVLTGGNTVDLSANPVLFEAGDLVAVRGSNVLRRTAAADFTYYTITGTTSGVLPAISQTSRFEWSATIVTFPVVTQLIQEVDAKHDALFDGLVGPEHPAGTASPVSGDATTATTSVICDLVQIDGKVVQLTMEAGADGNAFVHVFRPESPATAGVLAARISKTTVSVLSGGNSIDLATYGITVQAGDLIGVSGVGVMRRTSDTADFAYYAVTDASSVTLPALSTNHRFEWRLDVVPTLVDEVAALRSEVDALAASQDTSEWSPTKSYILVLGVGQSNLAGRPVARSQISIPTGRSYKYNGTTNTLVTLADPTGTDSTALSGSGRGSLGPAMARAVLEASNGNIGVIFVNTAIGGTTIATWQTGGDSWIAAVDKFTTAKAQIDSLKLNVIGCIGLMIQGESDASGGTTKATYKAGVLGLLTQLKELTEIDDFKLIMSQIGVNTTGDAEAHALIRQAQAELARENEDIIMAFSGAKYFEDRDLMVDNVHYSIAGLNEIGGVVGSAVLSYGIGSTPVGITD